MTDRNKAVLLTSGNIRLPAGRLSYPYLLEPNPKPMKAGGKPKYTTSILLPPNADITLARDAVKEMAQSKFGEKLKDALFARRFKLPFLKAEEHVRDEQFKGWTLIRLSSTFKPGIVDHRGAGVTEAKEIYPGRWAFLSVNAFSYDTEGNQGVSLGVVNVQLLEHDKPLVGSAVMAEKEFAPVEIKSDGDGGAAPASADDIFAR